jgi:hypothetical protein
VTAARELVHDLGPATEALFAEAFATSATITLARAAKLIGLDEKVLRAMTDQGVIRAVRKGKLRGYTERDLRTYLAEGPDIECSERRKQRAVPARSSKVLLFSEMQARSAPPKR